jgi:hypothetical protein
MVLGVRRMPSEVEVAMMGLQNQLAGKMKFLLLVLHLVRNDLSNP